MVSQEPVYRDVCGKCGARRQDEQIGLEKTPEEYVAKLVEVFREVRRVLRDDGTLWLNLGDTYNSGGEIGRHEAREDPKRQLPFTPERVRAALLELSKGGAA
jgi:DNA modification methylase